MADTKLSALTELAATPADNDEVYIRDVSEAAADESKRITIANLLAGAGATVVRKTADETVNNSTTLQNDDHLLLALATNEIWLVTLYLLTDSGATPGIKFGWAYPSGCSIRWGRLNFQWSAGDIVQLIETGSLAAFGAGAGTVGGIVMAAIVANSSTSGNLQLQWAQNTQDVSDTKVLTNSCLICHKLN